MRSLVIALFIFAGSMGIMSSGWLMSRVNTYVLLLVSLLGAPPLLYASLHSGGASFLVLLFLGNVVLSSSITVNIILAQIILRGYESIASSLMMGAAWGGRRITQSAGREFSRHIRFTNCVGRVGNASVSARTAPDAATRSTGFVKTCGLMLDKLVSHAIDMLLRWSKEVLCIVLSLNFVAFNNRSDEPISYIELTFEKKLSKL